MENKTVKQLEEYCKSKGYPTGKTRLLEYIKFKEEHIQPEPEPEPEPPEPEPEPESPEDINKNSNVKLNYIGSKYSLLSFILESIRDSVDGDISKMKIGDLFCGTCSVGFMFRKLEANVIANDLEYYSFIVAKSYLECSFNENIKSLIIKLNQLEDKEGLIYNNYAPEKGEYTYHKSKDVTEIGTRLFFSNENARRIDAIRIELEVMRKDLSDNDYYFLLASLIVSADKIANVASVYGAYLKKLKESAKKDFVLLPIHFETNKIDCKVYNEDINIMAPKEEYDVVYLDPPYNNRQYSKNYHILNYLAKYEDVKLRGKTGLFDCEVSKYSQKDVLNSFSEMIKSLKTKYIFLSYNNEGLMSKDEIMEVLSEKGSVNLIEKEYQKFKSGKYKKDITKTTEYLYCVKC